MVGYGRLTGGPEQYAATLCEVVVVGREFVGKYSLLFVRYRRSVRQKFAQNEQDSFLIYSV